VGPRELLRERVFDRRAGTVPVEVHALEKVDALLRRHGIRDGDGTPVVEDGRQDERGAEKVSHDERPPLGDAEFCKC
jgi:hypothetical protein